MAYKRISPIPVVEGGTGAQTLTSHGVLIGNTTGAVTVTAAGTTGQVLTATTGSAPTFQNASSGGITTLDGDTGSATGSTVTLAGDGVNITTSASGSTVTHTLNNTVTLTGNLILSSSTSSTVGSLRLGGSTSSYNFLSNIGTDNTFVGYAGNTSLTTASATDNTCIGYGCGGSLTTGRFNTFCGSGSGGDNQDGEENTYFGYISGQDNHSGNRNSALGAFAGAGFNGQSDNSGFGYNSLSSSVGSQNCAFGSFALAGSDSGTTNSCMFGYNAGNDGVRNNGFGALALEATNSSSTDNCGIGYNSLSGVTSGGNLIALGNNSGTSYTTEANNIVIANAGTSGDANVLRIGTAGSGTGQVSTAYIAGISGVTVTGTAVLCSTAGQLGTISSSKRYKENIRSLQDSHTRPLMDLRPVIFNYKNDKTKALTYGLIAEEVEEVYPELVIYKDNEPESIKYHELPIILLKEIQGLNRVIEELQERIEALEDGE